MRGLVIKNTGSWYTVRTEDGRDIESKIKGNFRLKDIWLLKHTSGEFNQTTVMITHNNEIAQLADRIVRIEDGKIVG